ncbi:MAG: hypothetical protein F4003_08940 [Acidimicrobiaceae bacterium]|nr:hypothetical protein [Acidimicrobiaceae bacterium]MYC41005.1 hypothetical protein [Acidimicrobiaceae bacterium]
MTRVRFEQLTLLAVALVHVVVQLAHGYSHIVADVPNTAVQWVFILTVIVVLPLVAVAVAFRRDVRLGASLFAVSMLASFFFGYLLHFVIDSPDLHSNVVGEHESIFFHSALNLALIELVGFVSGLLIAIRKR